MNSGFSNIAQSVDFAMIFITVISVVLLVLVTGVMIYFAIRYSSKRNPEVSEIEGNLGIELAWTIIPTILVMFMFYYGYTGFELMRKVPPGAMTVKVTGQMWTWLFEYENGKKSDELVLPVNKDVKLVLYSKDVLHSLFIPAFRVKEDAVPGDETQLWFVPQQEGEFDLFCTEYCGTGHSGMLTKVKILSDKEFATWYAPAVEADPAAIVKEKGCLGCHSTDGTRKIGPSFKDILGRKTSVTKDGVVMELVIDKAYLVRAIAEPQAEVVQGYPPIMPPFILTDEEMSAVINYLTGDSAKLDGNSIMMENGCLGCHSTDGTRKVGPSFKDIFGRSTSVIKDGATEEIVIDVQYLKRAILEPQADVVVGYPPIMPPFVLSDEQMEAIVKTMKGL
jgi:cytochrome c oxidase subunit 2